MKNQHKILIASLLVLGAAVAFMSWSGTDQNEAKPEPNGLEQVSDAPKSSCPNFKPPAADFYGQDWTIYSRPDECYSIAYPQGWGVNEHEYGANIRRLENLETTSYTTATSFAYIGVSKTSLEGLTEDARNKAEAAFLKGEDYCYDIAFNGVPSVTCYRQAESGNVFSIDYGTNPNRKDKDIIEELKKTIVVW